MTIKALLLAAGLGTRLKPLTDSTPKCLMPIGPKPLIEWWLETLSNAGITDFLINTHHLHTQVESFITHSKYKHRVKLCYEKELLGTGGTLLTNKDFFEQDESILVIHADNFSICDYKDFISAHYLRPKETVITMMTFTAGRPEECGIVQCDSKGIVQEFYEKIDNPPSNLANGAVYVFEYSIFSLLEAFNKKNIDISTEVLPMLIGKINTYLNNKIHIDIGTPGNYQLAQKKYKETKNHSKFKDLLKHTKEFEKQILEISSRLIKQKSETYKNKRILAIYDFIDLPHSNDISTFLIASEIERRKYNLEKIDILFVVHANDPSPTRHHYVTSSNMKQFLYNFAIEHTRTFEHIGSLFIFDNRNEFLDFFKYNSKRYKLFPSDYNTELPIEIIFNRPQIHQWLNLSPYLKQDSSLLCLTPPEDLILLSRKWIIKNIHPKIPITITLREWDKWANERNSKIDEWQKLINYFTNSSSLLFIIIRDYYKLYNKEDLLVGDNVIYCNEASLSHSFRSAIYQESTLNLFVSNGSAMSAVANIHTNYIFFSIHSHGRGATRQALRDNLGLYYGDSFQGASKYQKVVWERDTFDVLKRETDNMLKLIEEEMGLEPLFYNKSDKEVKKIRMIPEKTKNYTNIQSTIDDRINLKYYVYVCYIKNMHSKKEKIINKIKRLFNIFYIQHKLLQLKINILAKKINIDYKRNKEILLTDIIYQLISTERKVIIYGAGTIGQALYPILKDNIICYIDINGKFLESTVKNINAEVKKVEILLDKQLQYDYIIITPKGRKKIIADNLMNSYMIDQEKIIFF